MNTALIKRDLLDSLKADTEYRHAWNLENVYTGVCFQIRALREQREWSQAALGKAAKMAPERISILEDPNADTKPTLSTVLRIANAYDVGLDVRFVPYGTVIERSVKTDLRALEVPCFAEELPVLERSIAAPSYEANRTEAQFAEGPRGRTSHRKVKVNSLIERRRGGIRRKPRLEEIVPRKAPERETDFTPSPRPLMQVAGRNAVSFKSPVNSSNGNNSSSTSFPNGMGASAMVNYQEAQR